MKDISNNGLSVGDEFIIIPYQPNLSHGNKWRQFKCLDPDRRFTICGFSKSGMSVYYTDNRTNNNCKCNYCLNYTNKNEYLKSLATYSIMIVRTVVQKERDRKIKNLIGI